MTSEFESAARPQTGAEYLESLRDDRTIFAYGERVKDVTTHPAFRNSARTVASLYDAMHDPATKDELTVPTDTGNGGYTHPFFKVPRSSDDLVKSRDAIAGWARMTYGWMGRSPDYKASFLGTLGANDQFYAPYDQNARNWYKESQEKVLYWNHAIINPPVDRHLPPEQIDDIVVHGVKETDSGIIVSGAKVVATGAAITQHNFIASLGAPLKDKKYAIIATVPMGAPGVKLIARTSYAAAADVMGSPFDYPLSSRLDENDAILILDNVLIPWENVFLWGDIEKMQDFGFGAGMAPRMALQGLTRMAVKLDFIAGLLMTSLEITGTKDFRGVQTRVGEVLAWRSMLWSLTEAMVKSPDEWVNGAVQPNAVAMNAQLWFTTLAYPRVRAIVEEDLGSALIYLNSHAADFKNPEVRPYLDKYLRGSNGYTAEQRVKVLKMLWDATGTEFSGRHDLYERNYQGSSETVRLFVYQNYKSAGWSDQLKQFSAKALDDYDLNGWTTPTYVSNDDVSAVDRLNS